MIDRQRAPTFKTETKKTLDLFLILQDKEEENNSINGVEKK